MTMTTARSMCVAALAWLLLGPACTNDMNHDRAVPDSSSGGDSATGGVGGMGGATSASGSGGNDVPTDPCDYILTQGSSPSCPKCSPYSPQWDPTCTQEGLVCTYIETSQGGLGAGCTCQRYNENDSADGAVRMKFFCGL